MHKDCACQHRSRRRGGKQQGAALIVGLVLLLAMTLVAVTAMKASALDEKLTANSQYKMITYHGAESGLEQAWDQGVGPLPATTAGAVSTATLSTPTVASGVAGADVAIQVNESYQGRVENPMVPGYSLDSDYTGYFFDINSTARLDAANARSTHRSGAVVLAFSGS